MAWRTRLKEGHDGEEADADVSAAQLDLQALYQAQRGLLLQAAEAHQVERCARTPPNQTRPCP